MCFRPAARIGVVRDLTTISGFWGIEPAVQVGVLDADQRERDLDFGPVLHPVLDRVEQKKALRILERLASVRQGDELVLIEPRSNRDEVLAARGGYLAKHLEPR